MSERDELQAHREAIAWLEPPKGRCFKCHGPLVFHGDKARGSHFFEQECISYLQAELREWRSGKRRVFWRTYDDEGRADFLWTDTNQARAVAHGWAKHSGKTVRRVTVGPAKKKEAG